MSSKKYGRKDLYNRNFKSLQKKKLKKISEYGKASHVHVSLELTVNMGDKESELDISYT